MLFNGGLVDLFIYMLQLAKYFSEDYIPKASRSLLSRFMAGQATRGNSQKSGISGSFTLESCY